jgi:hypothetical protein
MIQLSSSFKVARVILWSLIVLPDYLEDEPELVCQRFVKIVIDGMSTKVITEIGSLLETDQYDKALKRVLLGILMGIKLRGSGD